MKRILFTIICCLTLSAGAYGQNANRSGMFVEAQAGCAFGRVIDGYYNYNGKRYDIYVKGGTVGSLSLGYRWATSRSFAFEVKADAWTDFLSVKETVLGNVLLGMRWTSREIGNSNKSIYLSFNGGVGFGCNENICANAQLGVGCNFTSKLYAGLYFTEIIPFWEGYDSGYYNNNYYDHEPQAYTSASIKIGYRF